MTYQVILRSEFDKRARKNSKYSLRAFARAIALPPSRLSEVLNGKQGLSREVAERVSKNLGFGELESRYFCDLVESAHGRSPVRRQLAKARAEVHERERNRVLALDSFKLIADWFHFAILELCATKEFVSDIGWIAKRLSIEVADAREAVERLIRVGQMSRDEDGTLRAIDAFTAGPANIPSEAIRKYHSQVLRRALLAIEEQPLDTRDFSTMVLAFDSSKVAEARELIRKFRRSFTPKIDQPSGKDAVYALGIQFFRLDRADAQPILDLEESSCTA